MYGRHAAIHESVWASGNQRQGIAEYVALSTGYNATLRSEDEAEADQSVRSVSSWPGS